MQLTLTPEQTEAIDQLYRDARGNVLMGQLRRHTWPHPNSGALFLDVANVPTKAAEAMRKAYAKATAPKP